MLCSTLTVIVLGLLAIVCFGLDYFIPEGHEDGYSVQWMKGTTVALLVVSVSIFFLQNFDCSSIVLFKFIILLFSNFHKLTFVMSYL